LEDFQDFPANESLSDAPKPIKVSPEKKKKIYANKTPLVKHGGYMTIDIKPDTKTRKELF
jgi:hypothetical protein